MSNRITREVINDYLQKGFHVHIREDDGKGNKRIVETIFVVEIPYYDVCDKVRVKLENSQVDAEPGNVVVASRAFLSPRDKPNKRVPNEVVVGRIIRKIEEGKGLDFGKDIDLCGGISVFQTWLTLGLPPRDQNVKKIAVLENRDPKYIGQAEEQIKLYKQHIEKSGYHYSRDFVGFCSSSEK